MKKVQIKDANYCVAESWQNTSVIYCKDLDRNFGLILSYIKHLPLHLSHKTMTLSSFMFFSKFQDLRMFGKVIWKSGQELMSMKNAAKL